jgi:hypothetical protein
MDITTLLTIIGGFVTTLGVTIGLFIYLANKIDTKIDNLQNMMYNEMKDFHNAIKEFHGRLCSIEERRGR